MQIKLKNSVTQDSTPSASDLPEVGELAVNGNINSIGGFMRASDNSIVKIFGPGSVTTPTATTTVSGISELATNAETTTGSATNRVVTPAGLNAVTTAERTTSNNSYMGASGGTLTGALTMPNGSNAAPAINFGDSDSGIFGGTNTVSLAAGGTTRLTADTGVSVVGTLAVTGAITSTSDLTIADKIIHAGDTNTAVRFPAADTVSVETSGSERARIDSSGRLLVGISSSQSTRTGTSSFSPLLQISSDNEAATSITRFSNSTDAGRLSIQKSRGTNASKAIVQNNDNLGQILFSGWDGDTFTNGARIECEVDGTPGDDDMPGRLVFFTTADGAASSTERVRIGSTGLITLSGPVITTGDVTIVNNSPEISLTDSNADSDFKIKVDSGSFRVEDTTNSSVDRLTIASDGTTTVAQNLNVGAGINVIGAITGTGNLTIDTSTLHVDSSLNRVGIGTTSPSAKLDVEGNIFLSDTNPQIQYNAGGPIIKLPAANTLAFLTDSTNERMRLDSLGRLLIGTTIEGNAAADNLTIATTGYTGMTIRSGGSSQGSIFFADASVGTGEYEGAIVYSHTFDELSFLSNHTTQMRIKSDGKVAIGLITPNEKLSVNGSIGHTDLRVLDDNANLSFYLTSPSDWRFRTTSGNERVRIQSGGGISFNGDTAAANALDDYEEGTWTPDVLNRTSAAPAIAVGKYVKIGSQVSAQCHLNFSSTLTSSYTSQLVITGLPFTSANVTNYFTVTSGVHFNNSFSYGAGDIGNLNGLLGINDTTVGFHFKDGAVMTLLPPSAIQTGNILFGITYSTV